MSVFCPTSLVPRHEGNVGGQLSCGVPGNSGHLPPVGQANPLHHLQYSNRCFLHNLFFSARVQECLEKTSAILLHRKQYCYDQIFTFISFKYFLIIKFLKCFTV